MILLMIMLMIICRLAHTLTFFTWVDFVSTLPLYARILLGSSTSASNAIAALRPLRILRYRTCLESYISLSTFMFSPYENIFNSSHY